MQQLKTVDIVGAGPAGLYAAILLCRWLPQVDVRVYERNPQGATFGFGVVFSDQALDFLQTDDPQTHQLITPFMQRWQNITLNHPDGQVTLDGVGFSAIARLELLQLLTECAQSLGAELRFAKPLENIDELSADLIIGADGFNSLVRTAQASQFGEQVTHFENRFAWFGTHRRFDTLTQTFVRTPRGSLNAHHYCYSDNASTFIVECGSEAYQQYAFAEIDEHQSAALCTELFAEVLQGEPLIANKSYWRRFPRLSCEHWYCGNRVLIGDAAHTAHFSIGSGTRLAMEDALALIKSLACGTDIETALQTFQTERKPVVDKLVNAANTSAVWYDSFAEKMALHPIDFAYDYLMRSGRIDQRRLRKIAPLFMQQYDKAKVVD